MGEVRGETTQTDQAAAADSNVYRLDDITLERIAGIYPVEMREPFLWLGWFVRERCHRELTALVLRATDLGYDFNITTWGKIIRGKWQRDKDGNPLPSPILALSKFLRAVEALRKDERLREQAGTIPFVETSTWSAIKNYIDIRRAPDRVNKFGIIVGHTGTQKTACFQEYSRRNNHGQVVWLESPENGSRKEFIAWVARKYGANPTDSYESLKARVINSINYLKTIIVDNSQNLYIAACGTQQPIFNFLRRIQDETKCTIILSITPEFRETLVQSMVNGYFEQFEGRAGGRKSFLVLEKNPSQEDVLAIAHAFGLVNAEKHVAYLTKIAAEPGRIRILFEELQTAKIEAQANKEKLTIEHIKANREEAP